MKSSNGTSAASSVFAALHFAAELPSRLESGFKARPFTTAAAIAGASFLGGTIFGSRIARAVLVAATPAIAHRLLEGPLGDDLVRYLRGALHGRPAESHGAS